MAERLAKVTVNFHDEEKAAVDAAAASLNMSVASFVRMILLGETAAHRKHLARLSKEENYRA